MLPPFNRIIFPAKFAGGLVQHTISVAFAVFMWPDGSAPPPHPRCPFVAHGTRLSHNHRPSRVPGISPTDRRASSFSRGLRFGRAFRPWLSHPKTQFRTWHWPQPPEVDLRAIWKQLKLDTFFFSKLIWYLYVICLMYENIS